MSPGPGRGGASYGITLVYPTCKILRMRHTGAECALHCSCSLSTERASWFSCDDKVFASSEQYYHSASTSMTATSHPSLCVHVHTCTVVRTPLHACRVAPHAGAIKFSLCWRWLWFVRGLGNTCLSCIYRLACPHTCLYTRLYTCLYAAPLTTHHLEPVASVVICSARRNAVVLQAQQVKHFRSGKLISVHIIPLLPTVRILVYMGVHVRWCACGLGHPVRAVRWAYACTCMQV